MIIPERFMVTGKRIDDGETVTGYYIGPTEFADCHEICTTEMCGTRHEVSPETIEPVAVKVIVETEDETGYPYEYVHYRCPNCKNVVKQVRKGERNTSNSFSSFRHCWDCGQRLDWSD